MPTKTDRELVVAYVEAGDESSFSELLVRHTQMVYRTCFRMLGNIHDTQDATQAVFIVLARKAGTLRREGNLGGWLNKVARNVALQALERRATSAKREKEVAMWQETVSDEAGLDSPADAALQFLDQELAGLSAVLRQAVVLRYLQGNSEKQAAELAACPQGTLSRRASDGIAKLRQRLAKRGVALGGVALAGLLTSEASAAVPETLLPSILAAVKTAVATTATATGATTTAAMLAKGAMKAMYLAKVKMVAAVAAASLVVAGGGTIVAQEVAGQRKAAERPTAAVQQAVTPPKGADAIGGARTGVVMTVEIPDRIAVPSRGGETKFEIGLRIANRTGKDLSFDLFDTVRPVLQDNHAPSRELPLDGGRNATRIAKPIEVKAGETGTVRYAARLSLPEGKTFPGLVVDDLTGGVWVYNDLKPGRYTLGLNYAHPPTGRVAQAGRWVGATITYPTDFLIGRALEVFGIEEAYIPVGEEFSIRLPYEEPPLRAEGTCSSDQAEYLGYEAGYLRFKARKEGMPTLQYVEFDMQGRPSGRGGAQADIIDPAAQADMLAKWPAAGLVFLGTNTALILARPTKVDLYRLDPEDYFVETVPGSRRPDPRIQGYMPLGQKTLTDEAVVDKIAGLLKSDGLDAGSHRTGDETVPKPTVCVRVYRLEKTAEFLLDLQSRTFSVCTPNVILDGRGWRGSHRATGKFTPESAAAWTALADELIPKK